MSTVRPKNNDLMQEGIKYKYGMRKPTVISIVLGVLLTVALIAFIMILVLYLKGQSTKEEESCNKGNCDVAIRGLGFLCKMFDSRSQVQCFKCARLLDDRETCEARANGETPLCTFDTTEGLCLRGS